MKVTNAGLQNDAETQDVSFETIFNGTAKAWGNLDGTGTIAERDSFNISGYVDDGTGDYTFTISADMSDANYAVMIGVGRKASIDNNQSSGIHALAAGSFGISCNNANGSATDAETACGSVQGGLA